MTSQGRAVFCCDANALIYFARAGRFMELDALAREGLLRIPMGVYDEVFPHQREGREKRLLARWKEDARVAVSLDDDAEARSLLRASRERMARSSASEASHTPDSGTARLAATPRTERWLHLRRLMAGRWCRTTALCAAHAYWSASNATVGSNSRTGWIRTGRSPLRLSNFRSN